MSRYRTGGTGVDVIGLWPDLSTLESDGRLVVAYDPTYFFTGYTTITAWHDGGEITGATPGNPDFDADDDRGFGLWFFEPDNFYGRTADGRRMGSEGGNRYLLTVRADGPSGWAECDLEISLPVDDQPGPVFAENALIDLGAITAVGGDTLVDMAGYLASGTVADWWVYAGDPTQLSGTPTFYMDGALLKLWWPSVSYSAATFDLIVGGRSADGLWAVHPRRLTFSLTATAETDPGMPAGWTLPPDPDPTVSPSSGPTRPLIDGMGHNPFIDSRRFIR